MYYYVGDVFATLFAIVALLIAFDFVSAGAAFEAWVFAVLCPELISAGGTAEADGYIGYMKPYATSHKDFDKDRPSRTKC